MCSIFFFCLFEGVEESVATTPLGMEFVKERKFVRIDKVKSRAFVWEKATISKLGKGYEMLVKMGW